MRTEASFSVLVFVVVVFVVITLAFADLVFVFIFDEVMLKPMQFKVYFSLKVK